MSAACNNAIRSKGLKIIKAINVGEDFRFADLGAYHKCCDYFLFDTKADIHGGSGKKFNWDLLSGYKIDKPFFLSGGIGPDDAGTISSFVNDNLYGVDVNSRFEVAPAVKDASLLKAFISKVKYGL